LSTLSKERQELQRILQIVEQLMQMHVSSLKDLGVDLSEEIERSDKETKQPRKPIEDIL